MILEPGADTDPTAMAAVSLH
eukprot:COSAG01_NODE_71063_length_257_cov_0.613924_1_plen_20_part_10